MRKLLTVLSAAIFVGSLAAQKKAAPAAAPKAAQAEQPRPAPATPAAPAVTPAPSSTPAPAASSQSSSFSIEGYGLFTLARERFESIADGDTTGTTTTYKLPGTTGFGGGLSLGYDVVEKLAVQLSFDYRSLSSRKWEQNNPGNVVNTIQFSSTTMWFGLGLRPRVNLGPGALYAGAGVAAVLPWRVTSTNKTTAAGNPTSDLEITQNWNLGLGAYGELGYQYQVTDMVYVGLGVRLLVAQSDNDGKTMETKNKLTGTTATTEYTSSVPVGSGKQNFESQTITDINFALSVGVRL